jgi:hypothetical protein
MQRSSLLPKSSFAKIEQIHQQQGETTKGSAETQSAGLQGWEASLLRSFAGWGKEKAEQIELFYCAFKPLQRSTGVS